MLQVNRYVLRLLAVAIVFGSISSCKSIDTSSVMPQDSSVIVSSANDAAKAFLDSGNAKNNKQDYQGAIADYTKAIRLNPNYDKAYKRRGSAKAANNEDYQGQIADLNEAIRINPNYADAYHSRGSVKSLLGYRQGGLEKFILGDKRQDGLRDLQESARLYRQQGDAFMYHDVQYTIFMLYGRDYLLKD